MTEITRQHLEDAALAAGVELEYRRTSDAYYYDDPETGREEWCPHLDDGDAAGLAARLNMGTHMSHWQAAATVGDTWSWVCVSHDGAEPDKLRAWRHAIALCAAAVGERMREGGR